MLLLFTLSGSGGIFLDRHHTREPVVFFSYSILKFLIENEILYIHNIDICCSNVGEREKKMVNDPYFSLSRQTNVIDSLGVVG